MADEGFAGALRRLREKLEHPDECLTLVSKSCAEEALNLIHDGFRREADPYGDLWKPKLANDGRKTLSGETGRLKNGWFVTDVGPEGFRIATAVNYAVYHQSDKPRRRLPRRMMIPDETLGLPQEWHDRLSDDALDTIEQYLTKRGL